MKYFEKVVNDAQARLDASLEKLKSDPNHYFTWVGEEIFTQSEIVRVAKYMHTALSNEENVEKKLTYTEFRQHYLDSVTRQTRLIERSTNPLSVNASIWRHEVMLKILDDMRYKEPQIKQEYGLFD